ncbi:MAG: excinuclease ABC subunit UvrB [Methanoculleaceae archaeon]
MKFELRSNFKPRGSQPDAIRQLVRGFGEGEAMQTLLGVTGSGKTFTVANVIQELQKPVLVIAHNKTLASQLHYELSTFFPENRVEYFVSYYDYYQPESYIPQKDQYIEKDARINEKIERMRLSATASLLSRPDTIVVASVSCIYGLGNPAYYRRMGFEIRVGDRPGRRGLLERLMDAHYERNDLELQPGRFRVRGDTIDLIPGCGGTRIRIELFGDEIDRITPIDQGGDGGGRRLSSYYVFPASHFAVPEERRKEAIRSILRELEERLPELGPIEAHRLEQRTLYDVEMIGETGTCKGIENYSRHFDGRKPGEKPYCLLDYFPEDFLMVIDESHQTIPQLHAMYRGDYSRKKTLVEYGFRLPSAFDNRPLKFDEFRDYMRRVIFVSATPGRFEERHSSGIVEQIIRPTGLLDPAVEVRPATGEMEDVLEEIRRTIGAGDRVLITTLTKRLAEELSDYLSEHGVRARYLHSDINAIERMEIINSLRRGDFDVLVGINLLREGLDIPEVGFIGILDADREGFLRDARSLIQTIGRAARNVHSHVVLYADEMTDSIATAVRETERRRRIQQEYNERHGIVPQTIHKPVPPPEPVRTVKHIPRREIPSVIAGLEAEMLAAAERLDFERAIELRDMIRELKAGTGEAG